jgi:hypothetical protein
MRCYVSYPFHGIYYIEVSDKGGMKMLPLYRTVSEPYLRSSRKNINRHLQLLIFDCWNTDKVD